MYLGVTVNHLPTYINTLLSVKCMSSYTRKSLTSNIIVQMGSQVEDVIDASIVNSQESHSHGHPINDIVSKPSRPSLLTTLHAGYYRICLSLGAQALLWKMLSDFASDPQQAPLHVFHMLPSTVLFLLWCLALLALQTLTPLYILRCFFHFPMVKAEFLHHIGVNFFYAPRISWLLMLQSSPLISPENATYQVLWFVFSVPVMALDAKIYGQWLTKEKRFLSKMANPTSQFSVLGNLVGARAAAQMGWKESAIFMFSLGMAHYFVLFVTLYQRVSSGNLFQAIRRPAFFLFFATPSMASLAWSSIPGAFDNPSKLLFFLSLFLFMSLVSSIFFLKFALKNAIFQFFNHHIFIIH